MRRDVALEQQTRLVLDFEQRKSLQSALRAARAVIDDQLENLLDSYTLGGRKGREDGEGLSIEGVHHAKPFREALKKIDAALAFLKGKR